MAAVQRKTGQVKYGAQHYAWKQPVSSIMNQLFEKYNLEGVAMPYTIQNYLTDVKNQVFDALTDEDILELQKRFSIDIWLKGINLEDRLKGIKLEDRLKGIKLEDRLKGLKPEDRLMGLKPEEIKYLLKKFH